MLSLDTIIPLVVIVVIWIIIIRRLVLKSKAKVKEINIDLIDEPDELVFEKNTFIRLSGQIKFSEYRNDQFILLFKSPIVLISTLLIVMVISFWLKNIYPFTLSGLMSINTLFFIWILFLPLLYLFQLKMLYKKISFLNSINEYIISSDNIRIKNNVLDTSSRWTNFSYMKETKHLILLYPNNFSATYIPKSMFTNSELTEFRDLLAAKKINKVK